MSEARPHCRATTKRGNPCRNQRLDAQGLCWRHDGRPRRPPTPRPAPAPQRSRVCRVCGHERPIRCFGLGATNPKTGAAYYRRTCRDCEERARRAKGIPKRRQRRNARGDVWCNHCQRYLPPGRFAPRPRRPHTFWAYCRECTRALDRLRARNIRGTPEQRAHVAQSVARKRRRRHAAQRERARFVQDAIAILRRRGLTKTDICRLAQVTFASLLRWERGGKPDPNTAARFGVLLVETAHLPNGPTPAYRRRRPHPEAERLAARVVPQLAALPVRSRWKAAAESRGAHI